jgi:hypothetical protein
MSDVPQIQIGLNSPLWPPTWAVWCSLFHRRHHRHDMVGLMDCEIHIGRSGGAPASFDDAAAIEWLRAQPSGSTKLRGRHHPEAQHDHSGRWRVCRGGDCISTDHTPQSCAAVSAGARAQRALLAPRPDRAAAHTRRLAESRLPHRQRQDPWPPPSFASLPTSWPSASRPSQPISRSTA